ncbi:MAG TPA: permease prefix domain 1-containing protein, partial [Trebonia sp.]
AESPDLVGQYLRELRAKLRTRDADLVLAEAEDHLREAVAAGLAVGMSEREAQEAAISSFGAVRTVVRAHHIRKGRVATDLIMTAWKLAWMGMLAVAASGVVAFGMNALLGRGFVGAAPAGTRFAAAQCQNWMLNWPGAHSCAQAAMLESSSDAVSLRLLTGGVAGLALLAGYLVARRVYRRRAVPVLHRGFFPLAAVAVFGFGAAALGVVAVTGDPLGAQSGPGFYLSGSLAALAVAAGYAIRARRLAR